jgi:hypothetical protein
MRQPHDPAPEPAWAEAREHLDAALASLSPARREAILRFYLQGHPQARVAADLGCSVDAVKTRVHEGLERLRVFFARRSVVLDSAALIAGLGRESAAGPGDPAACVHAVLVPASAPGAATLATGVHSAMLIKTASLAALVALLLVTGTVAGLLASAEASTPAPAASVPSSPSAPPPAAVASATAAAPLDPAANAALAWWQAITLAPGQADPVWALARSPKSLLPDATADACFNRPCQALDLLAKGAAEPYCEWGGDVRQDGAMMPLPYLNPMRDLVRLGVLRARWHAQRGEDAAAVDDLLVCMRVARLCAGRRPTMIGVLVGISTEAVAITCAARLAPQLAPEARRRLAAGIGALPEGATMADAGDQELGLMQWDVDRLLAMPIAGRVQDRMLGAGDHEALTEAQASDASLRACLADYRVDVARWQAHLRLPPGERVKPMPAADAGPRHPLAQMLSPAWEMVGTSEVRLLVAREQLRAALDQLDRGDAGLAAHPDPLSGKPFVLERSGGGFRLRSSIPNVNREAVLEVGKTEEASASATGAAPGAPSATGAAPGDF